MSNSGLARQYPEVREPFWQMVIGDRPIAELVPVADRSGHRPVPEGCSFEFPQCSFGLSLAMAMEAPARL